MTYLNSCPRDTQLIKYLTFYLACKKHSFILYDTNLGLYCIEKRVDRPKPLPLASFSKKEQFTVPYKCDTNAWIESMDRIIPRPAGSLHWSFYLTGHSSEPASDSENTILGLNESKIATLLAYFNHAIPTALVGFSSCYTSAQRLLSVVEKERGINTLRYSLLSAVKDDAEIGWNYTKKTIPDILEAVSETITKNPDPETMRDGICAQLRNYGLETTSSFVFPESSQGSQSK